MRSPAKSRILIALLAGSVLITTLNYQSAVAVTGTVSGFVNENDEYFHDDPIEVTSHQIGLKKLPLRIKLAGLAVVSILSYSMLGSTFATNLSMGSGRVEFGQGISQATACDSNVTITPYATFANASGASADYKLTSIRVTDISADCWGKDLIIKAYDATSSTALTLYQTGGSTNYSQVRVYDNSGNKIRRNGLVGDISVAFSNSWRNSWHHYAAVRGNGKYGIYVDGVLVVDGVDSGTTAVTDTSPTVAELAGFPNTYGLIGKIRNLRVVKGTALYSGSTVGTTYFTPQAAPLSKVSGTVLLLLSQNPSNASYDSSDYHWTPQNTYTLPTYVAP